MKLCFKFSPQQQNIEMRVGSLKLMGKATFGSLQASSYSMSIIAFIHEILKYSMNSGTSLLFTKSLNSIFLT